MRLAFLAGLALGCGEGGTSGGADSPRTPDGGGGCAGVPDGGSGEPDASVPTPQQDGDAGVTTPPAPPDPTLGSCSPIFAQTILPTYRVEISAEEWAKLDDEFRNREAREAAGLDPHPYHPIGFRWGNGTPIPNVLLRLKGNSSWAYTVELDPNPKMQFVIAFNEVDPDGRFAGLRKIELDMPRNDKSFLRQRLALFYLRGLGLEAQCANSARLEINGAYYGLFTALERLDKEFLQRSYPSEAGGDLWEAGVTIKTNETHYNAARYSAFWGATDAASLDAVADLDGALHEWAAEAMIPDVDGYWAMRPNYFVYDHPTRGFVWIAHDLDATFDYLSPSRFSPIYPWRNVSPRYHYHLVLSDPAWAARYQEALAWARAGYNVADLQKRVDEWSAQIADAAMADPHRPFSMSDHRAGVSVLRSAIGRRDDFIEDWLECRVHGGTDADGDGAAFCNECDDADPAAHPGALETCNMLDDDCDGSIDEANDGEPPVCTPPPPPPEEPPPPTP